MIPADRSLLERVQSALDAAWQDLHDWTKTARGLRERSTAPKGPDYDPACPHQRGIDQSEAVILKLGQASTELRLLLEVPEAEFDRDFEKQLYAIADAASVEHKGRIRLAATVLGYRRHELDQRRQQIELFVKQLRHYGTLNPAAESLADQLEEQIRTWR